MSLKHASVEAVLRSHRSSLTLAFDPTGWGTCRHGEAAGMGSGATGTAGHALVDAYGFSLREPGLDVDDVTEGDCG